MDNLIPILQAALGIGFLIFIHELGHYLCARLAGVRVEVFSLGFGTRLFGFVRGGTDYRVSLVPLGGYVRVTGEDPTQREGLESDALHAKGFTARFLFFSGGVVMNVLFALVAFPIVFKHGVEFTAPELGAIEAGGAAWEAGLEPGDRILRVDGKEMYSFENLQVEIALAGRGPVELEIERDGQRRVIDVAPRYSETLGLYAIGAAPAIAAKPLRIVSVEADSAAARAGLRADDSIVAVGGRELTGREADGALADAAEGGATTFDIEVSRAGERLAFSYVPDTVEAPSAQIGVLPALLRVAGMRDGNPLLARLGLRRGDVLLSVDGQAFGGDGLGLLTNGSGELTVAVRRDGQTVQLRAAATAAERRSLADDLALGQSGDGVYVQPIPDSPARAAGLSAGDRILAVDGESVATWSDLVDAVRGAGERPIRFAVRPLRASPDAPPQLVEITPARRRIVDLGFTREVERAVHVYRVDSIGGAISAGFVCSLDLVKQLYVTLKRLLTGDVAARNLGGIIQISRVSYHYAQSGWAVFVYFLALLSINLAFINVLPIPVLDGGHLLFLVIEKVKGSPVSARVLTYSQILGLVFVIALMVFVTYNDILKLL